MSFEGVHHTIPHLVRRTHKESHVSEDTRIDGRVKSERQTWMDTLVKTRRIAMSAKPKHIKHENTMDIAPGFVREANHKQTIRITRNTHKKALQKRKSVREAVEAPDPAAEQPWERSPCMRVTRMRKNEI